MAIIKDYYTSKPKRASVTHTWAWEVIIQEYNEIFDEYYDNIIARFFDPWKAVEFGIKHYKGMCTVQVALLHTDYLKGESEGK